MPNAVLRLTLLTPLLALGLAACPGDDGSGSGTSSETGLTGDPVTSGPNTSGNTTSGPAESSGGSSAGSTSTGTPDPDSTGTAGSGSTGDTGNDSQGVVPGSEVDCGGVVYECGDLIDNDGDGFFDLFDVECTGPCDDDESSFQTGLPGDNVDCIQDCFFDGNSGQGEGCFWDLTCDPSNPGAAIGCEYDGSNACDNLPHNEKACAMACEPLVPPGCDCFGCCTVQLDDGSTVDIFLNSDPECAIDNLGACQECTSQAEMCGNPCIPEECELCFGQNDNDLPPECEDNVCDNGMPCEVTEDCPGDYFCFNDCCYPPPPG